MEEPHWRKICCPVDFSEGSFEALRLAAALARQHDADLVLFHAYSPDPLAMVVEVHALTPVEAAERDRRHRNSELERCCVAAREMGAPRLQSAMAAGEPHRAIVDFATKAEADLIVMGTHGRTGLKHLLIGSVAERVVRTAPCAVLTCRMPGARPAAVHPPA